MHRVLLLAALFTPIDYAAEPAKNPEPVKVVEPAKPAAVPFLGVRFDENSVATTFYTTGAGISIQNGYAVSTGAEFDPGQVLSGVFRARSFPTPSSGPGVVECCSMGPGPEHGAN